MLLGQPEEISTNARYYLILLFPGYVFMNIYILSRRYFNCLGKTKEVLIISAFTFVLHIILLCFMVIRGRWGLTGVAVSASISLGVQLLIFEVYTYSKQSESTRLSRYSQTQKLYRRFQHFWNMEFQVYLKHFYSFSHLRFSQYLQDGLELTRLLPTLFSTTFILFCVMFQSVCRLVQQLLLETV